MSAAIRSARPKAQRLDAQQMRKPRNYPDAYDQQCDKAKAGVTREEYARRFRPPLPVSFRIGDVSMADQGADTGYDIAVEVSLDDGQTRTESYFVFSRSSNVDRYYVCPVRQLTTGALNARFYMW